MKEILFFIQRFGREINKPVFAACTILMGLMIWVNFHYKVDVLISNDPAAAAHFYYRYFIFLAAFALPWCFYYFFEGKNYFKQPLVSILVFISPAIFSWKMAMDTGFSICEDFRCNEYWNQIIYWPARLISLTGILFALWISFYRNESFFGLTTKNFKWKPYLLLLLIMVPLIAAASTQKDVGGDLGAIQAPSPSRPRRSRSSSLSPAGSAG